MYRVVMKESDLDPRTYQLSPRGEREMPRWPEDAVDNIVKTGIHQHGAME